MGKGAKNGTLLFLQPVRITLSYKPQIDCNLQGSVSELTFRPAQVIQDYFCRNALINCYISINDQFILIINKSVKMYTGLLTTLLVIAALLIYRGIISKVKVMLIGGIILAILTPLFFWLMGFWADMLWFRHLGYNQRFWTLWLVRAGLFLGGLLLSGALVYAFTFGINKTAGSIRLTAIVVAALIGGLLWTQNWEVFLKFFDRVQTSLAEPILKKTTGFYLFVYPFLRILYNTLIYSGLIAIAANIALIIQPMQVESGVYKFNFNKMLQNSTFASTGFALILLGAGKYLDRFGLFFSKHGVVYGPGWVDVHIRLPLFTFVAAITILTGIIMLIPLFRGKILGRIVDRKYYQGFLPLFILPGAVLVIWFIFLGVIPPLFQSLKVEPNELSLEKPYLANNIEFTRHGFDLDKTELKEFSVSEPFTREDISRNPGIFSNIRLWDYRALDDVFKQFQEIRLYYKFNDVDIDRYQINGDYREVMVSAREMDPGSLPLASQTFVNTHFLYTHGFGIVLTPVNEFTPGGLPDLLIKNIPPVSAYPDLDVKQPAIYYGEITNDYVVANSKEQEFDYPAGEKNIYTHYAGNGGVQLSNFWRRLIYGWKMGGTQFLLTSYITHDARIMFHRQIIDRVKTLAPFLYFDVDPYIVLEKGNLYWIIDAFTTTKYYPYSEPFASAENIGYTALNNQQNLSNQISTYLNGKSYLRNSVKIIINAYSGEVEFYIYDEKDPLIQVYDRIFPGFFKKKSEMPQGLVEHVRFPSDMLLAQGLVYTRYHMTDPEVFYNQEDLWVRATEKYYSNIQAVEPYYVMWEKPDSHKLEFILMLPFTPKSKQVLVGWLAGLCDTWDYGRLLAFEFPKEKMVLGTQQMETKIDQDSYLSGQLSLWDQHGSSVIRGNVLVIPLEKTILYVEPIYLQSQTAAYPELRIVTVMNEDKLAYAKTFDEAINNFFSSEGGQQQVVSTQNLPGPAEDLNELIKQANKAFEDYLQYMEQKRFNDAGNALNQLQQALQELSDRSGR